MMNDSFRPPPFPSSYRIVSCRTHLRVQGEILAPGDRVKAVERFTPAGVDSGVVFIKMADGRGWCPIKSSDAGV